MSQVKHVRGHKCPLILLDKSILCAGGVIYPFWHGDKMDCSHFTHGGCFWRRRFLGHYLLDCRRTVTQVVGAACRRTTKPKSNRF